jgi:hypothetical protein
MAFEYDEAHRMIEEALASIRLYARFGASPLVPQQARCVAYILKKTGVRRHSRILTEAADAICRAYAGHDAPDEPPPFEWPEPAKIQMVKTEGF